MYPKNGIIQAMSLSLLILFIYISKSGIEAKLHSSTNATNKRISLEYSFVKPLHEKPQQRVTEQQIKCYALEGFDQPGYCFYVRRMLLYAVHFIIFTMYVVIGRWRKL